jgi:hypothetical protein
MTWGLMMVAGCASWKSLPSAESSSLPLEEVRESKRQLILEFQFVKVQPEHLLGTNEFESMRFEAGGFEAGGFEAVGNANQSKPSDPAAYQEMLWQSIDETKINLDSRRHLIANGIRVGLVSNHEEFGKALESARADQDVVDRFFDEAEIASDVPSGSKRTPMRMGRRHEVPLQQPMQGSHVALVRLGEETVGKTMVNPQYMFAITPTRSSSRHSEVVLNLRPEIQHGDVQQRYVRSHGALRIDASRETWAIEELDLQVNVKQGDVLVLGPTHQKHGMASHMFASDTQDEGEHALLLIRAAQVPAF